MPRRARGSPAVHPWRVPCRWVSGNGMRVEPSLMHPEGGSWTDVRTHTPIKFSKVRTAPLAPIPLDRSKFRENGSQPSPNRTCTFGRIRLSILVQVLEAVLFNGQHSHDLFSSMEPKDCLPSPQRLAFDRVATSYPLADPDGSGCSTHYR